MEVSALSTSGLRAAFAFLILCVSPGALAVAQSIDRQDAANVLRRVVHFYRTQVGFEGAYLWRYSVDLTHQEGEETATRTSGWTQPPGAPFVGEAFLRAWYLSQDENCRQAAVEVANALVRSQLKSGGWGSHFDLGPEGRRKYKYRVDGADAGKNNLTTFDDNKSQSALTLLMHVDEALNFQDQRIHEAVQFALDSMLAAQYPNGAWPQQYSEPPSAAEFRVRKAAFPETWSRTWPKQRYIDHYTLNDGNMSCIIDMLFEAHRIYGRDDCFRGATATGDFFLLAQLPEPQPGWAQQYDRQMHPAWARKFEPPAVTGGESQGVMRSLLTVYQHTGQDKYIATLPQALAYYRRSLLPDGRLARFYELRTNRPLYFTKDYQLTDSDADMPTHYAFKVSSGIDSIERRYQQLIRTDRTELKPSHKALRPVKQTDGLARRAAAVIRSLDDRGAWIEEGKMRHQEAPLPVIEMRTFAKNLEILAAFAGASD